MEDMGPIHQYESNKRFYYFYYYSKRMAILFGWPYGIHHRYNVTFEVCLMMDALIVISQIGYCGNKIELRKY